MATAEYRAIVPAELRCFRMLSPLAQLVVTHLRCYRFSSICGVGEFDLDVLALDCNSSEDDVRAALSEACKRTKFCVTVDDDGRGTYWIPWQLEYDPPPPVESNHKGYQRRLEALPESREKSLAVSAWNAYIRKTPPFADTTGGRPRKTGAVAPTTTTTPDPITTTTPETDIPRSATQPSAATAPDDTAKGRRKKSDDTEAAAATALIAAYNETRGSMPQCEGKPDSAAHKAARTRWRAEPDLDLWRKRFVRAEASDFLSGRKTGWRADLLWLLNKTNAEKLDMGRYDNVDASSSNDGREYVTIGGRQVAVNLPRAPLTEEQLALDKYYENLPPEF